MEYNNDHTWRLDQDNRRRAKEILTGTLIRDDKKFASRDEILSRVRMVGVEWAAKEYRIRPEIIRHRLKKEGMSKDMNKDTKKDTPQQADTRQDSDPQPAPQKIASKKSNDFSPEERKAILARATIIGTRKAAAEAGTSRSVVMRWQNQEKFAAQEPVAAQEPAIKHEPVAIIPGSGGLPPKKEHMWDYSVEDRIRLIAKADEVGYGNVSRAYDLKGSTLWNWKKPGKTMSSQVATPRKPAAEKQTAGKQSTASLANASPIMPAQAEPAPTVSAQTVPMEPAAPMHTVTPVPAVQAAQAAPAAPEVQAVPVAPTAPAVPVAPDTIDMIRLKDRIALLEERIEMLRKVITDLI